MKFLISQEIEWHESHRGASGKRKEFEDGFIAGLKQALLLMDEADKQPVGSIDYADPIVVPYQQSRTPGY